MPTTVDKPISKAIRVRFRTPAEKQAVVRAAKRAGTSISRFITSTALAYARAGKKVA
jgi:uncharacterized protein (DUF1778 family)